MQRNEKQQVAPKSYWRFYFIFVVLGVLVALYTFNASAKANELSVEVKHELIPTAFAAEDKISVKVDELKELLWKEVVACENPQGIPVVYDDNKAGTLARKDKVSYGLVQYKLSTFQGHYKQIEGKDISDMDAARFLLSPEMKEFALRVWIEIPGSINHWTCSNDQIKRRIEDIRLLTA